MMQTWSGVQLLGMGNLVLCLAIVWCCICRLNSPTCQRWRSIRLRWAVLLTAAVAHGFQPLLFHTWANVAGALFSAAVLLHIGLRVHR